MSSKEVWPRKSWTVTFHSGSNLVTTFVNRNDKGLFNVQMLSSQGNQVDQGIGLKAEHVFPWIVSRENW